MEASLRLHIPERQDFFVTHSSSPSLNKRCVELNYCGEGNSGGKVSPRFPGAGHTPERSLGGQDFEVSWVERCKVVKPSSTLRSVCGSLLGFTVAPGRGALGARRAARGRGALRAERAAREGRRGDVASAARGLPARAAGPGPRHRALDCAPQGLGRLKWCAGLPRRSRLAAGRSGPIRGRLGAAGRPGSPGRLRLPERPAWQVPGPRVPGSPAPVEVTGTHTPPPVGHRAWRARLIGPASLVPRPFAGRSPGRVGEVGGGGGSNGDGHRLWDQQPEFLAHLLACDLHLGQVP